MLGCILLKMLDLCHRNEVTACTGGQYSDAATALHCRDEMESSTGAADELSPGNLITSLSKDEEQSKLGVITAEKLTTEKSISEPLAQSELGGQQKMNTHIEAESQNDSCSWSGDDREENVTQGIVCSPTADGSNCHGPTQHLAKLGESSNALEEVEGRLQAQEMVGEALMRGSLTVIDRESAEAVDSKEAEKRKIKDILHDKEGMTNSLACTLQKKEDELLKLVDELHHIGHQLAMGTLTERDRVLESMNKTKDFFSDGGRTEEVPSSMNDESNIEIPNENKLEDCEEFVALKGRDTMEIDGETKRFKLQRKALEDLVRWEARLKEQFVIDSWVGKETDISKWLQETRSVKKHLQDQCGEIARVEDSEILKTCTGDHMMKDNFGAREKSLTCWLDERESLKSKLQESLDDSVLVDEVGCIGATADWNAEKSSTLDGQVQEFQDQKPSPQRESSARVSQNVEHNAVGQFKKPPTAQNTQLSTTEAKLTDENLPKAAREAVILLRRENAELRREKEQLLENRTDEIFKLKRELYNKLVDVKRSGKSVSDFAELKEKFSGLSPVAALGRWKSDGHAETKKFDQSPDRDLGSGWDSERLRLLESISQRDEQLKERDEKIKDVSNSLTCSQEKERDLSSTRASLEKNLAAFESEKNQLISLHLREKQELIARHQKLLEDKNEEVRAALQDSKVKNSEIMELKQSFRQLMNKCTALNSEVMIRTAELKNALLEKGQGVIELSQRLEEDFSQRLHSYNLRLEKAQDLLKAFSQQASDLTRCDKEYPQCGPSLQLAETEVDVLGDEVDVLMDLLEKVHSVLSHYSPVIQHYPGLAELWKVVKQEFLRRVSDSADPADG